MILVTGTSYGRHLVGAGVEQWSESLGGDRAPGDGVALRPACWLHGGAERAHRRPWYMDAQEHGGASQCSSTARHIALLVMSATPI